MSLEIDKNWTLFLDRDGVINHKRDNDYVKNWAEFSFINGSVEAISMLSNVFGKILIVTNQRGVGRGLMTEDDLIKLHKHMLNNIELNNGKIDRIYYCTEVLDSAYCRKPNIGMGKKALFDFPEIDINKSIMVGDSLSDMEFGRKLGMKCIFISSKDVEENRLFDFKVKSLEGFMNLLIN
jgi:histidinol-phosphate phosphatase family protein